MADRTMANLNQLVQLATYSTVLSLNICNVMNEDDNSIVEYVLPFLRENICDEDCEFADLTCALPGLVLE